jgi:nitrogen fixation protein FixH
MKGKHLVIGIVLFVIAIIAAIYFSVMAEYNKDWNGMEPASVIVDNTDVNSQIVNI